MSWYYAENGERKGPVNDGAFNALLKSKVITASTLVWEEGMIQWRPYGELAREAAPPAPMSEEIQEWVEDPQRLENAARAVKLSVNDCIHRAWHLHRRHFLQSLGATLLAYTLIAFAQLLPVLGAVAGFLVNGPLMAGLFWFFLQLIRTGEAPLSELFAGFQRCFLQLFLCSFITGMVVAFCFAPAAQQLGLVEVLEKGAELKLTPTSVALVVAGGIAALHFTIIWIFALPLIIDKELNFLEALRLSRRVATRHWGRLFLLFPAGGLLVGVVAIVCLFSVVLLNQALKGVVPTPLLLAIEALFSLGAFLGVFALLPVFFAALMHAYEDLFGMRQEAREPARREP